MSEKGGVSTFLWVEQSVCDRMAKQRFFIDLLALEAQTGADKAMFTAVSCVGYWRHSALHTAISHVYRIENVEYHDQREREGAVALVYMRSMLTMQDWIGNAPMQDNVKLVLVAESDCFEAVVQEFGDSVDIEVYTDNPRIVMALASKKGMGHEFSYHTLQDLPQREPERKEAR